MTLSLGLTVNESTSFTSIEYAIYSVTFEVDTKISTKNRLIVCFEKSAIKMEQSRILTHILNGRHFEGGAAGKGAAPPRTALQRYGDIA